MRTMPARSKDWRGYIKKQPFFLKAPGERLKD